jgi:hypothetical protein
MANHHRSDARVDCSPEWKKFDTVETLTRQIDDRQAAMRIDIRIAMSGKMLRRRENALALQAGGEGVCKACDILGILTEASEIDHGVIGIVVYIYDRGKNMPKTECVCFAASYLAHTTCKLEFAGSRDGHCPWEVLSIEKAHPDTRFSIERHQKRYLCRFLHSIGKMDGLINRADKEYDAADLVFGNVPMYLGVKRALLIGVSCIDTDMYELADLFIDRHFFYRPVGPLPRGSRWLKFRLSRPRLG